MQTFHVSCRLAYYKGIETTSGSREAWIEAETAESAIDAFQEANVCMAPVYAEVEAVRAKRILDLIAL